MKAPLGSQCTFWAPTRMSGRARDRLGDARERDGRRKEPELAVRPRARSASRKRSANAARGRGAVVHLPVGGVDQRARVMVGSGLVQRGDAGQLLALEELERRAAAGRHVGDPVGRARLRHGRRRVAAADDGDGAASRWPRPWPARPPGCRGRTAASRTRPSARSTPPCPPRRSARRSPARSPDRCRRPPSPAGIASRATVRVSAPASSSCAITAPLGSTSLSPGLRHELPGQVDAGPPRRASCRSRAPSPGRRCRPWRRRAGCASTLGSSASIRSILPLILAPPSTATNGRLGWCSASPR